MWVDAGTLLGSDLCDVKQDTFQDLQDFSFVPAAGKAFYFPDDDVAAFTGDFQGSEKIAISQTLVLSLPPSPLVQMTSFRL